MSNLFKSGFQGLQNISSEPFVIDVNSRVIEKPAKIIRPLEEQNQEEEIEENSAQDDAVKEDLASKVLLDDAMDMAKTLRDDAMLKAAKIIADAEADAENIRETARQEGYNIGLEEGSMEAMKRADNYLANMQKEQEEFIAKQDAMLEEAVIDREHKLIDLSCALIEKVTGILVRDYKPVMLHMINSALNEVETSKKFVIKVSEENYSYVEDNKERLVGAGNPNIEIEIYGDSRLEQQQCIIETDSGIIDLSMDIQTRNLITAIKLLSD